MAFCDLFSGAQTAARLTHLIMITIRTTARPTGVPGKLPALRCLMSAALQAYFPCRFGSLLALLKGKPGLVLGGQEVEAHSLGCVQDLVDHLDLVSPPIAVLELCPAHVKLKAVASNVLRTTGTPLLGGDHAQHLLVRVRPLLVHIICLARHFLEVAGSLVEESVQSCILKHFPCLLLQEPHLLSNDCELAASGGPGELVGLLDHLGQLHQVELVLLANLVGADQLETTRGLLSWHQVYCVLKVWSLGVEHHQLCLLVTTIVDVCHLFLLCMFALREKISQRF